VPSRNPVSPAKRSDTPNSVRAEGNALRALPSTVPEEALSPFLPRYSAPAPGLMAGRLQAAGHRPHVDGIRRARAESAPDGHWRGGAREGNGRGPRDRAAAGVEALARVGGPTADGGPVGESLGGARGPAPGSGAQSPRGALSTHGAGGHARHRGDGARGPVL